MIEVTSQPRDLMSQLIKFVCHKCNCGNFPPGAGPILVNVPGPPLDRPGRVLQGLASLGRLAQAVVGHGQQGITDGLVVAVRLRGQELTQPPDRLFRLPGPVMGHPEDVEIPALAASCRRNSPTPPLAPSTSSRLPAASLSLDMTTCAVPAAIRPSVAPQTLAMLLLPFDSKMSLITRIV